MFFFVTENKLNTEQVWSQMRRESLKILFYPLWCSAEVSLHQTA